MAVDVQTETQIQRPRAEVAEYTADLSNATAWYTNITEVEWKTPPPLAVGAQVAFVGRFLGRRLAYTYEITDRLRNTGEPAGFSRVYAPLMAAAMRRANRKDLARLKKSSSHGSADGHSSRTAARSRSPHVPVR
jgi:hypothetical protein